MAILKRESFDSEKSSPSEIITSIAKTLSSKGEKIKENEALKHLKAEEQVNWKEEIGWQKGILSLKIASN